MDKNKIIEAATKLVQKGAYDKAIKEYQKVLDADPREVRVLQKMGELYQKKNDNVRAAQFFGRVAESYSSGGFFLKAVALYKQVLKLDPNASEVNLKLADLHEQLGLVSESMGYLQIVANQYDKSGDPKASLDTLKRMVDLDPENVASRVKLAEMYVREKLIEPAIGEFRFAADYLKQNSRMDDYLRVAERISTLVPTDAVLARELAELYLGRADPKRALSKLQICFKANPRDVETLNLLSRAFEGLGQTSKTVSVLKELAKIHKEQGRTGEATGTWQRIGELDPDDADWLAKQGTQVSARPAAPSTPRSEATGVSQRREPVSGVSSAGAPAHRESLAKLLTETDVYLKYGLHDKALDHLKRIFEADPESLDAHEKAYQIYVAAEQTEQAAEQLLNVLRLCTRRNDVSRAQPYLRAMLAENPDHPEVPAFLAVLQAEGEIVEAEEEIAEEAILVDEDREEVVVSEAPPDALAPAPEELALASAEEPEEVIEEEAAIVPDDDAPELDDEPLTYASEPLPEAISPWADEEPAAEELSEAEFLVQQGLYDEAREILEAVLIAHPDHAKASALLEQMPESHPEVTSDAAPVSGGQDAFDLASELADELGPNSGVNVVPEPGPDDFQYSVEEVFQDFKKGLQKVVKPGDIDTHYDLGIAYKEMGLVDDAISEFKLAREGSAKKKKELDCLTMIGLLQLQKGDAQAAVAAFQQALATEFAAGDTAKALEFELGIAWEAAGNIEKALAHFQRVAQQDPAYRGVGEIVSKLRTLPPKSRKVGYL
ncbi:MAG: tetratricopeptide repeat protein [Myxococcaceae bacterium]